MNETTLTVKQFAECEGVTTAAVYKKLNTSYKPFVTVDNTKGRPEKRINAIALSDKGKAMLNEVINQSYKRVDNGYKHEQTAERSDSEPADERIEKLISALTEQLKTKDAQIEQLMQDNAAKTTEIQRLTELLSNGQLLQGHTQKLLESKENTKKRGWLHSVFFND